MKCCNQINHVVGAFGEKLSGDRYKVLSAFYMQYRLVPCCFHPLEMKLVFLSC